MKHAGPMEDRLLIRELYDRYADASCRGSQEDWLACWTPDGRWTSHLFDCCGTDELRSTWESVCSGFDEMGFFTQLGPVAVTGDTATARSFAREIIRLKSGGLFKLVGAYEDQMRRDAGVWRFSRRDYRVLVQELPE